jgi:hypothetical protein
MVNRSSKFSVVVLVGVSRVGIVVVSVSEWSNLLLVNWLGFRIEAPRHDVTPLVLEVGVEFLILLITIRIFLLVEALLAASESCRVLVTPSLVVSVDVLFGNVLLIHDETMLVAFALIGIAPTCH